MAKDNSKDRKKYKEEGRIIRKALPVAYHRAIVGVFLEAADLAVNGRWAKVEELLCVARRLLKQYKVLERRRKRGGEE